MARIFTTPAAEQAAKRWLAIVTVAGGLRTDANIGSPGDARFKTFATDICDELVNRNFNIIDNSIRQISYYGFSVPGSGKTKHLKPEQIAKCIVYMAEQVQLYWDDTIRTPYEIDEFKKSYLGNAVYTYGRYISAIPDKPSRSRATSATSGSGNGTGGAASNNGQPKNGYKQSGPQSGNVRDLRDLDGISAGTPGNKVFANASGNYIYKIIGDKTGSNTPNVFIKPLSASGAAGNTNKIFISSGNGYTDCTCYFDDPNDAQDFLDKINQNNRIPNNVANLRVVKMKADPNGYFLVGTEFGVVAISAKTLNEALAEAVNEQVERSANWEKATEGYTREQLDELHTWMRRD
jgi:hypothetical protein